MTIFEESIWFTLPTTRRTRLPALATARTVSVPSTMREMKDTARALVRVGYDGRVHKVFRGHQAEERFGHEVRVLRHLEANHRLLALRVDDSRLAGLLTVHAP